MKLLFIGYIVLLQLLKSVEILAESNSGCPSSLQYSSTLKTFRGICYQFVPVEKKWTEAKDYCRKYGGTLVKIPNSEVNEFLKKSINNLWWTNRGIWIGLNDIDVDKEFVWTGLTSKGEKIGSWSNWGSGHPNGILSSYRNCIRMVRDNGAWKWHETLCNSFAYNYRSICQYTYESQLLIGQLKGHDNSLMDDSDDRRGSRVTLVAVMCLTCLFVLAVVAFLFAIRRLRRQRDATKLLEVKNKFLESAIATPATKTENVYVDEATQKFLKAQEVIKQENLYEEIPYDRQRAEIRGP